MTKDELEKQTMEWKNNYILKLEKRCANYEMEISKMEKGTCDICKESEKDKRLAELEKENAELRKLKRECETSLCRAEYQYNYEHLTNAKEIIRSLYFVIQDRIDYKGNIPLEDEMYRAKQFLREVEK